MDLINKIKSNLKENEFKITLYKNYINILNYENIDEITIDSIILNNKKIFIYGENLKIIKLLDEEILAGGNIKKVEYK